MSQSLVRTVFRLPINQSRLTAYLLVCLFSFALKFFLPRSNLVLNTYSLHTVLISAHTKKNFTTKLPRTTLGTGLAHRVPSVVSKAKGRPPPRLALAPARSTAAPRGRSAVCRRPPLTLSRPSRAVEGKKKSFRRQRQISRVKANQSLSKAKVNIHLRLP